MIKDCTQQIAQLQNIQTIQTQLDEHVDDFSNHQNLDKDEKIDKLKKLYSLRCQLRTLIREAEKLDFAKAERLIGKENFFGPKEVMATFGIKVDLEQIPDIDFTEKELKRAKELNQFLILRIDKAPDGAPLTMEKMRSIKRNRTKDRGRIFFNINWYKDQTFFTRETVALSWALTTREVVEGTVKNNYLQQTKILITYLVNEVFRGRPLPTEYREAIDKFNRLMPTIKEIIKSDYETASSMLENLSITKLLRRSPVEVAYDLIVVADGKSNGTKLLSTVYDWTSRRTSNGGIVDLGYFQHKGVCPSKETPFTSDSLIGACLSRRSSSQ